MTIAEPMLLPSDVELTPVEDLPEEIRAQLVYRPGDHAITRPRARSASSIVDRNTARLLGSFRTPTRIVDAVLGFANDERLDPRETLERSFPVLKDLLASGFLVPADSAFAEPIESSVLSEGASVGRFRVVRNVHAMIDTQLCLARDDTGTDVALKVARPGFWLTSIWFYLLPLGQYEVFGSANFWLGLFYITFPLGMIIYGWNDVADRHACQLPGWSDQHGFRVRPDCQ